VNYTDVEVVCFVYGARSRRVHRTVHNNGPRTVSRDTTVRKNRGLRQEWSPTYIKVFHCKFSCKKAIQRSHKFGLNVIENLPLKREQTTLVGICIRIL
jgi:hypothetical protein